MKYKEEYDNHETVEKYDSKKKKFTKSTMSSGFLSKAVREMYPSLKEKPSDSPELKKAIQLARRSYNSYIDEENQENFEPALKKKKFRQTGGGRKSVAVEVSETGFMFGFCILYLLYDKKDVISLVNKL